MNASNLLEIFLSMFNFIFFNVILFKVGLYKNNEGVPINSFL